MTARIKELRKERNMSQIRLSIELGVSQETISAYESGKHYPSVESLIKLSDIFGVSCDYILSLSDIRAAASDLNNQEQILITKYRALSPVKREVLLAYLTGLSNS